MTKALSIVLAVTAACRSDTVALPDLGASLDAVRADFNAHRGEARFLTLLSPT
jgi:hypothetical protein